MGSRPPKGSYSSCMTPEALSSGQDTGKLFLLVLHLLPLLPLLLLLMLLLLLFMLLLLLLLFSCCCGCCCCCCSCCCCFLGSINSTKHTHARAYIRTPCLTSVHPQKHKSQATHPLAAHKYAWMYTHTHTTCLHLCVRTPVNDPVHALPHACTYARSDAMHMMHTQTHPYAHIHTRDKG